MPTHLDEVMSQMSRQLELPLGDRGAAPRLVRSEETESAVSGVRTPGLSGLMERVVDVSNIRAALKRVKRNKGSAGVDGMTVGDLTDHLRWAWPRLREQLLDGSYKPQPVREVRLKKPGGGERMLGIPTVVDRFIQQAILQVLQPLYDPTFSEQSYGFRPGRGAHGAVKQACAFANEGRHVVVDVDLSKFFDRVHHDVLMGKLAKDIGDKRLLRFIRRYLSVGVMRLGEVKERHQGTPQGGPLSPLLANILLDEVDQELSRRGHAFVRYADDLNVFVRSKRAGERVMALLRKLFGQLHLVINEEKSAVAKVFTRTFLGFAFWRRRGRVEVRVSDKAKKAMKDKVRLLTRRQTGRSLHDVAKGLRSFLLGWKSYFRLAETPSVFRSLDEWVRHRLRAIYWKQKGRGSWWRRSGRFLNGVLPIRFFDELGVPQLVS